MEDPASARVSTQSGRLSCEDNVTYPNPLPDPPGSHATDVSGGPLSLHDVTWKLPSRLPSVPSVAGARCARGRYRDRVGK